MPICPTQRSEGGSVMANRATPRGHHSMARWIHSLACCAVMASGIIVNRGMSGSWHDSTMSGASINSNGRRAIRSLRSGGSGGDKSVTPAVSQNRLPLGHLPQGATTYARHSGCGAEPRPTGWLPGPDGWAIPGTHVPVLDGRPVVSTDCHRADDHPTTSPSIDSRIRSACPQWRAYSAIR